MPVETVHRGSDDEQTTVKCVTIEDATGETHSHEFAGPPGGPYEYADDGDVSGTAAREIVDSFLNPPEIQLSDAQTDATTI